MARQAATFATPRPGYWTDTAGHASKDFLAYLVFCKGYLPSDHHLVIVERLLYGGRLELVLGPPGSGKSSIGTAYIEWILGRNPNYRWLVASEVGTGIATTIVSEVGSTLEYSERFQLCFGELKDPTGRSPWSTQSISIRPYVSPRDSARLRQAPTPEPPFPWLPPRGRDLRITGKHPSAKAVGWRYGYAGARCEGIWADDLVSDSISRSEKLTEEVYETLYRKLLGRLVEPVVPLDRLEQVEQPEFRQHVVLCGQRWAPRDLFSRILEHGWICYDNNPDREGLWILDEEAVAEAS